jgi:hypothetical protein
MPRNADAHPQEAVPSAFRHQDLLEAVEADFARNRARFDRRTVSKRWLSAANQKRIPHYQRAMDCGAQVRDVRVTRRRSTTAVNPM